MYPALHVVIVVLYAVLPVGAAAWATYRTVRRKRPEPVVAFLVTCLSGVVIGTALVVLSATIVRGRVGVTPVLHAWYTVIALLVLMHAFRWGTRRFTWWLFRVRRNDAGQVVDRRGPAASFAFLFQSIVMVAVGLPYVTAAVAAYRVPVYSLDTPATVANRLYDAVEFPATDGTRIAGWWVPAAADTPGFVPVRTRARPPRHQTVILCGALADSLPRYAGFMTALVGDGYDVLAFDLRGSGDSHGHWAGFGATEAADVGGAVRWLREAHPDDCRSLFAVGFGVGGAAVIAAAADPDSPAAALDAVAVVGSYARFDALAAAFLTDRLSQPVRWLTEHVSLPVLSAHAGVDLARFAPANLAPRLWPRPLLVIHGRADHIVPFGEGEDLFRAASFPRQSFWVPNDHVGTYRSRDAARALLRFFNAARRLPAV